ncbi:unnamed protein product [Blepharisma stoltei]|uniref:Uncharacterized protein n=1 Tax=Blepharisma stoltei TaxID=1481888 RepID=A0AAU9JPG9_9CILI|nr:unnamed protein product [Blepharisma stoltei]
MNKYSDIESRLCRSTTPDCGKESSRPQTTASFSSRLFNTELRKQLSWRYIHSTPIDKKNTKSSSPSNSTYKINLVALKELAPGEISSLTDRENFRAGSSYQDLSASTQRLPEKQSIFKGIHRKTNNDYIRIIDRLDKIVSNQGFSGRRICLTDEKSIEGILDTGEAQFFYVPVRGERCPLRVKITQRGKLAAYVSRTTPEPCAELCEKEFRTEEFQFAEPGMKFNCENIYMSLFALINTKYIIRVAFGQQKESPIKRRSMSIRNIAKSRSVLSLEQIKNDVELRHDFLNKVNTLLEKRKREMYETGHNKNFVKLNLNVVDNEARADTLRSSTEKRDRRHEEATERKHNYEVYKKQRTIDSINRHMTRKEKEELERQILEKKSSILKCHKFWFSLIDLCISIQTITDLIAKRREMKVKKLMRNFSAWKIQRAYRNWVETKFRGMPTQKFRARNILLLTGFVGKLFIKPKTDGQLILCIKSSKTNYMVRNCFGDFFKKIVLIQTTWKKYQETKKNRYGELVKLWNSVVGKIIKDIQKKSKRRRKVTNDTDKYFSISKEVQSFVINEYLTDKYNQACESLKNTKGRIIVNFIPSPKEMRWLIDRAANIQLSLAS